VSTVPVTVSVGEESQPPDSAEPTPRRRSAVVGGVLLQTSVSQVELALSCPRKWWYRYVGGHRDPDTAAQSWGHEGHAQIAEYLRGGARPSRRDVLRGMHLVPAPGGDLLVERTLTREVVPGVTLVAKIDLAHARGDDVGGDSPEPDDGLLEVVDWKFPSSDRYLPGPGELRDSTQLAEYARVLGVGSELDRARISLGCFIKSPASARKISAVVTAADLAPTWRRIESVVRQCQGWASAPTAEDVPADTTACGALGGCPRREICAAAKHDPLDRILGASAMSTITSKLAALGVRPAAPPPTTPSPDPAAEAAALAAAERRAALDPELVRAVEFLRACPRGRPSLGGAAAQVWGAATGVVVSPQAGLAGAGELGAAGLGVLSDPDDLVAVALDLGMAPATAPDDAAAQVAAQAHPASISPPDAPISAPATALVGAETKAARKRAKVPVVPSPSPVAEPPGAVPVPVADEVVARVARVERVEVELPTQRVVLDARASASGFCLVVVNASVAAPRASVRPLAPWVDALLAQVGAQVGGGDPRLAESGPAAYGRWRVLVEVAAAAAEPPGPGIWSLDVRAGDELGEAAARGLARRGDLVLVRG